MDDDESLEQWVREEKLRLDRFAVWYRAEQKAHPDQDWPSHKAASAWDEDYQTFHEPEAPASQS